jgi:hypothetical protein
VWTMTKQRKHSMIILQKQICIYNKTHRDQWHMHIYKTHVCNILCVYFNRIHSWNYIILRNIPVRRWWPLSSSLTSLESKGALPSLQELTTGLIPQSDACYTFSFTPRSVKLYLTFKLSTLVNIFGITHAFLHSDFSLWRIVSLL